MKRELREKVWEKYNKHCAYCGCILKYKQLEVDHLIPRERGGEDTFENYLPACKSCNTTKSTYLLKEFRKRLLDDVARLRRDSSKFRILSRFGIIKQQLYDVIFYFERIN